MLYQLYIVGYRAQKRVDVANSEEEFRNTTVEELKRIILKFDDSRETYPNKENLRLVFSGRQLEDRHTLGLLGITHLATIHVLHRLLGGGLPPPEAEGMSRTASMDRLASMQQTEPEPNKSCLIL